MARLAAHLRIALLIALAGLCGFFTTAHSREAAPSAVIAATSLAELPPEAAQTLERIRRGGPFPYPDKDGSIFGNFEKRLPPKARGYYREFTVPTPGSRDRGARRIVTGTSKSGNAADSGEYYYSPDHYRSFVRIREP
ncbi:ribonuclease domain-containing protein [uncultured Propionivibrio sp.]|uniref:ribonuclease domain-containing protein n=1 Tax=uncultured Propionivibrio sp. TaxID=426737 RepID=UPI0029C04A12|nr:ribonuclease domain-containing protein [uncultured Propionivibrio sp.]